jgi:hypothetical protein
LSAIVTPGALSVEPLRLMNTTKLQVPQPLYNFTNYGSASGYTNLLSESASLTKLLAYTASSQNPVQLDSAFQNQTYNLIFNGPALKCQSASEATIRNSSYIYTPAGSFVQFASWLPANQSLGLGRDPSCTGPNAARIFVMTNIDQSSAPTIGRGPDGFVHSRVNVTECLLYNVTYDVDFTFRYPNQTHRARISAWLNPYDAPGSTRSGFGGDNTTAGDSYMAMMSAFDNLLVGTASIDVTGRDIQLTRWDLVTVDWSRAEAVQRGLESLFQNFTLSLLSDPGLM